jgi:CheY-like chemotaxis protein
LQHLAREGAAVDLVLSDVVMPGLGGRAFASRLAAEHPAVPLVWMSGYPRDSAFFGGADGDGGPPDDHPFLQKPIAPAVLAETVRELLAEAQPAPGR